MGELIGAKVPAVGPDEEPSVEEVKQHIVAMREFLPLLYERTIEPLGEKGEWAEADIAICTDLNDIVVGYMVLRVSVDDEPVQIFGSGTAVEFPEWCKEIAAWAHSVEGMERWTWFHIHPEGMGQPSANDEHKVRVVNMADFQHSGHLGAPRKFQSFIVTQINGIIAMQSDETNGVSPKDDAITARIYAESYARVLGYVHPLVEAMDNLATALEEFVAEGDSDNPFAMLMFSMKTMMPLQVQLDEARASAPSDFMEQLKADYEANGPVTIGSVEAHRPTAKPKALGFQPPVPSESLPSEELPALSAGVLADLAQFNFDGLDA